MFSRVFTDNKVVFFGGLCQKKAPIVVAQAAIADGLVDLFPHRLLRRHNRTNKTPSAAIR